MVIIPPRTNRCQAIRAVSLGAAITGACTSASLRKITSAPPKRAQIAISDLSRFYQMNLGPIDVNRAHDKQDKNIGD